MRGKQCLLGGGSSVPELALTEKLIDNSVQHFKIAFNNERKVGTIISARKMFLSPPE